MQFLVYLWYLLATKPTKSTMFDAFVFNFELILHIALVFPLLTLNKEMPPGKTGIENSIKTL